MQLTTSYYDQKLIDAYNTWGRASKMLTLPSFNAGRFARLISKRLEAGLDTGKLSGVAKALTSVTFSLAVFSTTAPITAPSLLLDAIKCRRSGVRFGAFHAGFHANPG